MWKEASRMKYLHCQRYLRITGFHDSLDRSPSAAIYYKRHTKRRIARRVDRELADFMGASADIAGWQPRPPMFLPYKNALR